MEPSLSERDQSEIQRSAAEASKAVVRPIPRAELERYLNARADTPFSLEYAFYLLGDMRGKTVLDLGCGQGENTVALVARGARVRALDISPELVEIAARRLREQGHAQATEAEFAVGSAYETGLPPESVEVVFCMSLIHHLDIGRVRDEMWRILRPGGVVILKEPVRFSKLYARLRGLLPSHEDVSDYEHPLTREELALMTERFQVEGMRFFRLPFVPLLSRLLPATTATAWKTSGWMLRTLPALQRYATSVVVRLRKAAEKKH
jgi:2-polyprenyl-3-methyl-5-hydroxy-6-metoxy-1,4-benzoquinol methylase